MFANVSTLQFASGKSEEAGRILSDSIAPLLAGQPGFQGFLLLVQPENDKAISINLWDTAADFGAFWMNPVLGDLNGKLLALFAGAPGMERYEVAIREIGVS